MKNKTVNKILVIVLILNIVFIGMIYFFMKNSLDECLGDPLLFGAKELSEKNNAEFSCSCSLNVPNGPLITFDQHNLTVGEYFGEYQGEDVYGGKYYDLVKKGDLDEN